MVERDAFAEELRVRCSARQQTSAPTEGNQAGTKQRPFSVAVLVGAVWLHEIKNACASERRHDIAVITLKDEFLHFRRIEQRAEFQYGRGVRLVATYVQVIGVRRLRAFDKQSILVRLQFCFQRVVGVDQCEVNLVKHARQHRRFQFLEFQMLGVADDVQARRHDVVGILERDQALFGDQQQRTTGVGRVVGDGDGGRP